MDPIINPGKELFSYIEQIIFTDLEKCHYLDNLDSLFYSDGEFSKVAHMSFCYYVTRRLITYAIYKERQLRKSGVDIALHLRNELRVFLKLRTRFPDEDREKLVELLLRCVSARKNGPSAEKRRRLIKNAKNNNSSCYLCGCELDFESKTSDRRPIIEHIWPQSLGGTSQECNLKVSCVNCSEIKGNTLGVFDFHFEEMSLVTSESDCSFLKEFSPCYRLAFKAKDNFECTVCGKSADEAGELYSSRIDKDDSFHFFNVSHACVNHR